MLIILSMFDDSERSYAEPQQESDRQDMFRGMIVIVSD